MKLFLASSLCFVSDVITRHVALEDKKVGCIRNAAKQRGGKEAFWNQRDADFFQSEGAEIVDIDLEGDLQILKDSLEAIDIFFVGGGDSTFLSQCFAKSGIQETLVQKIKEGLIYMGTSAGSMVVSSWLPDTIDDEYVSGLGLTDFLVIPHWNQPAHKAYWMILWILCMIYRFLSGCGMILMCVFMTRNE